MLQRGAVCARPDLVLQTDESAVQRSCHGTPLRASATLSAPGGGAAFALAVTDRVADVHDICGSREGKRSSRVE